MTEAEWLAATAPTLMLSILRGRTSDRKFLLTAAHVCRCRCGSHPLSVPRAMIAVSERWADGRATPGAVDRVRRVALARRDSIRAGRDDPARDEKNGAANTAMTLLDLVAAIAAGRAHDTCHQASMVVYWAPECGPVIRDIFGNPFRPVSFSSSWGTATVLALARGMYESRDFSPMPILADALQDAGCESADLLAHCRQPRGHVRGCWAVDLLHGKE
jgi:hypothetical protein